jgi:hypothetical protein
MMASGAGAGAAGMPNGFRPGDWICSSCGNHNYASKANCNKCHMPKVMADASGALGLGGLGLGMGGGGVPPLMNLLGISGVLGGGVNPKFRQGDWMCSCGNHNYASRSACGKCGVAKELVQLPNFQGHAANFRPGDWMCSCGNHNYASRTACGRCGVSKDEAHLHKEDANGMPPNFRVGDWMCACGAHNYASKTHCHKCSSQKPANLEGRRSRSRSPRRDGRGRSRSPR